MFANAVREDLAKIKCLENDDIYIRVFVQRTTFDSYWISRLEKFQPHLNGNRAGVKKELSKKAKILLKMQATAGGQLLIIDMMNRLQYSERAIEVYGIVVEPVFEDLKSTRTTRTFGGQLLRMIRKNEKELTPREFPKEYNFEGILTTIKLEQQVFNRKYGISNIPDLENEALMLQSLPAVYLTLDYYGNVIDSSLCCSIEALSLNDNKTRTNECNTQLTSVNETYNHQETTMDTTSCSHDALSRREIETVMNETHQETTMEKPNDVQDIDLSEIKSEINETRNNQDTTMETRTDVQDIDSSEIESEIKENNNNQETTVETEHNTQRTIEIKTEIPEDRVAVSGSGNSEAALRFSQICGLCDNTLWLEHDSIDFILQYFVDAYPNSEYAVTKTHFVTKQSGVGSAWISTSYTDQENVMDVIAEVDYTNANKFLHPLYLGNHWILMEINKINQSCVLYDSFISRDQIEEVRHHVLPHFMTLNTNLVGWNIYYSNDIPLQTDSSSCGLYLLETAKLILSGRKLRWSAYENLRNTEKYRIRLVSDLLQTSAYGKLILAESKSNPNHLKKLLAEGTHYYKSYNEMLDKKFPFHFDTSDLPKFIKRIQKAKSPPPMSETTTIEEISSNQAAEARLLRNGEAPDTSASTTSSTCTDKSSTFTSNTNATEDSLSSDEEWMDEEIIFAAKAIGISDELLNFKPKRDFEIIVPSDDVSSIFDFGTGRFKTRDKDCDGWPEMINSLVRETQGVCSFSADRSPEYAKTSSFAKLSGHCGCGLEFKITVPNIPMIGNDLVLNVNSIGNFKLVQSRNTGRQVRGSKRERMGEKLASSAPIAIKILNTSKEDALRLLHNNHEHFSVRALQQINYEKKQHMTTYFNIKHDIDAFADETSSKDKNLTIKGFVHASGFKQENVFVHLYTQSSINLLAESQKRGGVNIFVDATGSLVSNIGNKKLLYYLIFAQNSYGDTFPVAASVSHRGRASDIADLFKKVKVDIMTLHPSFKKNLAQVATCDFSSAMIQGIIEGINIQTVPDYLQMCFQVLNENREFDSNRTVLFVCTAHIIKSFSRNLAKKLPKDKRNTHIKKVGVHAFAHLQGSKDLISYLRVSRTLCEMFCLEKLSDGRATEIENMLLRRDGELLENVDISQEDLGDIFDNENHIMVRKSSIFYKLFKSIREIVLKQQVMTDTLNPNYCPEIVNLIEDYYSPYAPLFCSMMLAHTGRHSQGSLTTAHVESEFNIIKNQFHHQEICGLNIFIRKHHPYFVGRVLQVLNSSRIKQKTKRRKERNLNESKKGNEMGESDSMNCVEEIWERRPRGRKTYFISKQPIPPPNTSNKVQDSTNSDDAIIMRLAANVCSMENDNDAVEIPKSQNQVSITGLKRRKICNIDQSSCQNTIRENIIAEEQKIMSTSTRSNVIEYDEVNQVCRDDNAAQLPATALGIGVDSKNSTAMQLSQILQFDQIIGFDNMDFFMEFLLMKNKNSNFEITKPHVLSKLHDDASTCSSWISNLSWRMGNLHDNVTGMRLKSKQNLLHPLYLNGHWNLIHLDLMEKLCTLYEFYDGNDTSHCLSTDDVHKNIVPNFISKEEVTQWKQDHNLLPLPIEFESTTGIAVYAIAKSYITGTHVHFDPCNGASIVAFRYELVKDILQTTNDGQLMLQKSGNDISALQALLEKADTEFESSEAKNPFGRHSFEDDTQTFEDCEDKFEDCEETLEHCEEKFDDCIDTMEETAVNEFSKSKIEDLIQNPEMQTTMWSMLRDGLKKRGTIDQKNPALNENSNVEQHNPLSNCTPKGKAMVSEILGRWKDKRRENKKQALNSFPDETDFNNLNISDDDWDLDNIEFLPSVIPDYKKKLALYEKHSREISNMPYDVLEKHWREVLPELREIYSGKLFSSRHELFVNDKRQASRKRLLLEPYTEWQDHTISSFIRTHLSDELWEKMEYDSVRYCTLVMFPETLIRIYSRVNGVTYQHAEKELEHRAAYDGKLSDELSSKLN